MVRYISSTNCFASPSDTPVSSRSSWIAWIFFPDSASSRTVGGRLAPGRLYLTPARSERISSCSSIALSRLRSVGSSIRTSVPRSDVSLTCAEGQQSTPVSASNRQQPLRSSSGSGGGDDRSDETVRAERIRVARQDPAGIAVSDRVEERLRLDVVGVAPGLDHSLARPALGYGSVVERHRPARPGRGGVHPDR